MPAWLPFNEEKATQVAGRLLGKAGGRLSYLKLIKLLYYVDRSAILRWGRPITTDRLVSMPHGPVVSRIYDLISVGPDASCSPWHEHIEQINYDVQLKNSIPLHDDELSPIEEHLIDEIWAEHGWKNKWALRDETHDLPEWQDPNGSSIPIEYADILRTDPTTPQEQINLILSEIEDLAAAQCLQATAG